MTELDHLVLVAESLESGADFVVQQLKVAPQLAWTNAFFGTHSLALKLGEACHLEIIAIDPEAPQPVRRRWYKLDDPGTHRTLARRPSLFGWVVRVANLDTALAAVDFDAGEPITMSQGELVWRQSVRRDGELVMFGAGPSLIERHGGHPSRWLSDKGCTIETLRLSDEQPAAMKRRLAPIGADQLVHFEQGNPGESRVEVVIRTPSGTGLLL